MSDTKLKPIKVYYPQQGALGVSPLLHVQRGRLSMSSVDGWRVYCDDAKSAYVFPANYIVVIGNQEA